MERAPRVAAAYDIVIAYGHLRRPIELAQAVDRLRELADPDRHAALLGEAERLRSDALRELGVIELAVAPARASVMVDGRPRPGMGSVRWLYLRPGPHGIRVEAPAHDAREIDLVAHGGSQIQLRAALQPTPLPLAVRLPENPYVTSLSSQVDLQGHANDDAIRRVLAGSSWALGALAWLSSVVVAGTAYSDAEQLARADPTRSGFLSQVQGYREQRVAATGAAVAGGILASAATLLWPWTSEEESHSWWMAVVGAALVVVGGALLIRSPERLGATRLTDPVRTLGTLLVSGGAPLVLAPLGVWLDDALRPEPPAVGAGLGVLGSF
jgi:hypothetical protein